MAVRFVSLADTYLSNTVHTVQNSYTASPFVVPGKRDKCRPLVVYIFIVSGTHSWQIPIQSLINVYYSLFYEKNVPVKVMPGLFEIALPLEFSSFRRSLGFTRKSLRQEMADDARTV